MKITVLNSVREFVGAFSKQSTFQRALIRLTLAPVALLLIFTVVVWISNRSLMEINDEAAQSHEIVNTSHEILLGLINMETGLRGYLVLRNKEFLDPYWLGKRQSLKHLERLEALTEKNLKYQPAQKQLRDLRDELLQYSDKLIDPMGRPPTGDVSVALRQDKGRTIMSGIRRVVVGVVLEEETASFKRGQLVIQSVRRATTWATIFTLALGFFLVFHIRREISSLNRVFVESITKADRAHSELEVINNSLETIVAARAAELEAFCYSVSHDLRAPLRGIDGFSLALVEDYGTQLPPEAQKYLGFVRQGVQKMGRLIDDLLALSRVSRKELNLERVDLAEVAGKIWAELKMEKRVQEINFKNLDKAEVLGDAGMLNSLMTNLLSNSWKFTEKKELAEVEFGQQSDENGRIVFYIKDNGAGFDMAHYDKLFGAFQRLHSPKEFQGTGIGLATVRRIARRHEGDVWAEAEPGRGATFYFTIGTGLKPPEEVIPQWDDSGPKERA